ncbi:MAG: uroporphyrinogen-III C-methyltransferase [Candidatus Nanopelagicales bacterium]
MTPGSNPRYPVFLALHGRRVLVVGGGPVAARRARDLVSAGARVEVVAPFANEDVVELAAAGDLVWHRRDFEVGDVADAWLVHTATGEPAVDELVASTAEAARIWCVRADDATQSSAWRPAVARHGDVTVAVSGGGDPGRATALRDAVQLLLEQGALPVRPRRAPATGRVTLVGGGPGDPGLITVRGRRLLAEADVVVVDRLGPRGLLDELEDDVEVIEAGKAPHAHTLSQEEINDLLVQRAGEGKRVVRLKGGDPYVLGRGGEEAIACVAAGIPVEVVPGVTSAVAVPAVAGIPVTHRGLARGFAVVTAHDGEVDWTAYARIEGTLVLLMGVTKLRTSAAALVDAGRPASTPVAIVERGTTQDQRTTVGTLADIADRAAASGVTSPAVVVVGEVAGLHRVLAEGATQAESSGAEEITSRGAG